MAGDQKNVTNKARLGGKIRRLRRNAGMSQARLAGRLSISASYLNLIEHNRRNVTVALLLKLTDMFGLELADLAKDDEGQLVADLMEAFADNLFDDHDVTTNDLRELVSSTPTAARAVLALYRAYHSAQGDMRTLAAQVSDEAEAMLDFESTQPAEQVSDFIQANANHFPDIEDEAERIRAEAGLDSADPAAGLVNYLQTAFGVRVAILPPAPGFETVRRFLAPSRTLEISEALPQPSRNFQIAHQLGLLAASPVFEMLSKEGNLAEGEPRALGRIALANYFAGALLMPYEPFLDSATALRCDIELLQHHFNVSFEQACQRLTSLQRPGAQGVPFHMLRVDIAGNISKRFTLSGLRIPRYGGACPRWNVYSAFLSPGTINAQISRMSDGGSYFCIARTVQKGVGGHGAPKSILSIGLGCELAYARELVYADGFDLESSEAGIAAGLQCRSCDRMECRQRAFPPVYHRLNIDENRRAVSAYV
ncbi:MAG: short-chain fatty acyl-CoA regulator family protein [Alphaproteobacteria bacterium]|nr:short-chain fatty acyl-CoA regulator family protein [Alphaproteobacteria bacterium]MDP6515595.1 short-chain fatty acyl-CoA regulator family protein [Alphaproteobacteria bacterium]